MLTVFEISLDLSDFGGCLLERRLQAGVSGLEGGHMALQFSHAIRGSPEVTELQEETLIISIHWIRLA